MKWAQSSELFTKEFVRALARECHHLSESGAFTKAAIGHGAGKSIHAEIRGDYTYWITPDNATPTTLNFLNILQDIQQTLNQELYLGLKRFETHFALYPPETGYDKHIDNPRRAGHRLITFVLYLNENWEESDGGKLTLFNPDNDSEIISQVNPHAGNFVLFCSDVFPHKVETSFAPRMSLTGWLRNDAL